MELRNCSHVNRHGEPIKNKLTSLFSPLPDGTASSSGNLHANFSLKHRLSQWQIHWCPHGIKTHQVQTLRILHLVFLKHKTKISKNREEKVIDTLPRKKQWNNNKAAWVLGLFWFHVKKQILVPDVTLDPKRFRTALLMATSTFLFKYLVSYYTCEFFRQQQAPGAPSGKKWHRKR